MARLLCLATRKGVWIAQSRDAQGGWAVGEPSFLGHQCHHVVQDPRDPTVLLCASRQWHLGPTVFRSVDLGKTWKEAAVPPQFPKGESRARAVDHVFWLTPGHPSQPGVWYAGTSPQGLFRSEDGGVSWSPVSGFNDHPEQHRWVGSDKDQTPDGGKLHSILVAPDNPDHLFLGLSGGGIFESLNRGADWRPRNHGVAMDFAPPLEDGSEYPFGHDPHCIVQHPQKPERLWHQNHCGIYRLDLAQDRQDITRWERVGRNMPQDVGDIGFPIVVHPRDPDTAWVFPMDGTQSWPRTSPGGKPAVYRTRNAGESWDRCDQGFPKSHAWWTVKRQAMTGDAGPTINLFLGTTNGEVWTSPDEGASFHLLFRDLPQIYAVSVGHTP